MNWEAIGAIGEIVGAGAVVLTLGYLAISIRQTITTAKIDSRQRVLDRYSDALSNVLAPNILDAMRNGLQDFGGLSSKDQAAFTLAQTIFANNLLNAMRLRDEGTLDHETFMHISNGFVSGCRSPGGAAWWKTVEPVFPSPLVDHVNSELASTDTAGSAIDFKGLIPSGDSD